MRSEAFNTQQRLSHVLDAGLAACGSAGDADSEAQDGAAATQPCHGRVWAQASGSWLSLGGAAGLDTHDIGLLVGTDGALNDVFHLGVEAGVDNLRGQNAIGRGNRVDNVHAGVYAFAELGPAVLSATLDALHGDYHVQRATGIGLAGASTDGHTLSAGLQVAWPGLAAGLKPRLGVLYQHQALDGFDEHVASSNPLAPAFGVTGARTTATSVQPYAGMGWSTTWRSGAVVYVPSLEASYYYQANHDAPKVPLMAQDGTVFLTPGTPVGRGMGAVRAGIGIQFTGSWRLDVDYQGWFANHLHDNALSIGFDKQF